MFGQVGRWSKIAIGTAALTVPVAAMVLFQNFSRVTNVTEFESLRMADPNLYASMVTLEDRLIPVRNNPQSCMIDRLEAESDNLDARAKILASALSMPMAPPPVKAVYTLLNDAESKLAVINTIRSNTTTLSYYVMDITSETPPAVPSMEPLKPFVLKVLGSGEIGLVVIDNSPYQRGPATIRIDLDPAGPQARIVNAIGVSRMPIMFQGMVGRIHQLPPPPNGFKLSSRAHAKASLSIALSSLAGQGSLSCDDAKFWSWRLIAPGGSYSLSTPSSASAFDPAKRCEVASMTSRNVLTSNQASIEACRAYARSLSPFFLRHGELLPTGRVNYDVRYAGQSIPPYAMLNCSVLGTNGAVRLIGQYPEPNVLDCLNNGSMAGNSMPPELAVSLTFGTAKLLGKGLCSLYDVKGGLLKSIAQPSEQECYRYADQTYMMPPATYVPGWMPPERPAQVIYGFRRIR